MGYEATLTITKELDNQYKCYIKEPYDVEVEKNLLLCLCMGDRPKESNRSLDYNRLYKELSLAVKIYINALSENWKLSLKKELEAHENKFYVCGRDYINNYNYNEINDIEKSVIKRLILLCINYCANPFTEKTNTYYKKLELVEDIVEDVEYEVNYSLSHQFFNEYLEEDKSNLDESY